MAARNVRGQTLSPGSPENWSTRHQVDLVTEAPPADSSRHLLAPVEPHGRASNLF